MATGSDGGPNGPPTDLHPRAMLERAVDVSMNTAHPPPGAGTSAEDRLEAELRRLRQGGDFRRIPTSPLQSSTPGFGPSAGNYPMNELGDQHAQRLRAPLARDPSPAPRVSYRTSAQSPTIEASGNTRSRTGNSSRSQPSRSVTQRIDDWEDRPHRDSEPQRFSYVFC